MREFNKEIYNDRYFRWHNDNARPYSIPSIQYVLSKYSISSMVDFGCGIGSYIEAAVKHGLDDVKGYEYAIESAKKYTPLHIQKYIEYGVDCTKKIHTKKYDCVISIEVAEHIIPTGSDMFVDNISNSVSNDGMIIFSAAQPNQRGSGHINCRPKEFWVDKFENHGLKINNPIYEDIKKSWGELSVPYYILNNFFILTKI